MNAKEWAEAYNCNTMLKEHPATERKIALHRVACVRFRVVTHYKLLDALDCIEWLNDLRYELRSLPSCIVIVRARESILEQFTRDTAESDYDRDTARETLAIFRGRYQTRKCPRRKPSDTAYLLREVHNPFRVCHLCRGTGCTRDKCPACRGCGMKTHEVPEEAEQIALEAYNNRDFALLPVLADRMEDSGCDDGELLKHLRYPFLHVRGCWALDELLFLNTRRA